MYTTAVGQRDSVRLPDGTRVVLGPGSRLAVDQGYGTSHREVGLRGEAYFDAQHGGAHPFVVRAGNATVRDVGTVFAIHSDPGDGVRVVVASGAVVLQSRNTPGDSGVLLRQCETCCDDLGLSDAELFSTMGAATRPVLGSENGCRCSD